MYFYWDPTYILVIIGAIICMAASGMVKSTFNKYSKFRSMSGMTGAQAEFAEKIQEDFGEVTFIFPEGIRGEFGFLTSAMTEGAYEEKAKAYPQICHMIRVEE